MLTELRLQNFRCFEDHTVPLRSCTVVVGKNNAGKSTLVEALRIVSIASSRLRTLGFRNPPAWTELPIREVGVAPSLAGLEFNRENLFHRYGAAPAIVTASFASGATLRIYLGDEGDVHAVLRDASGSVIGSRAAVERLGIDGVEIMPQVGPLERSEAALNPEYVRRNLSSALASRHFRNQLRILEQHFQRFRDLSEQTWPGLQVQDLSLLAAGEKWEFSLLVRTDDFVTEIAAMGHGLQMWLQTMWFLSRVSPGATVILDEPDVYMHPDLQRRLMRYLRKRDSQVVVTTHSVEIMSEVEPEDILVLDRKRQSAFAGSFPAVQRVLDGVGSAHNLQLAKLWHSRRCLLVEGGDFGVLCDLFDVVFPEDKDGLADVPSMSIGGWSGFANAIGSSLLLRNAGGEQIAVYCILDSDFHTDAQISKRREQARAAGVRLHVWARKEIENYLLVPSAIHRAIESRSAKRTSSPTVEEVGTKLVEITESLKDDVFDGIVAEIALDDRSLGPSRANKAGRAVLAEKWKTSESRIGTVPGKVALSQIAKWSQDEFGVSLNAGLIARSLLPAEIAPELRQVLTAISRREGFIPDRREAKK